MKLTKGQYLNYLIDCKGYDEEEAIQYIALNGVKEIDEEARAFNN